MAKYSMALAMSVMILALMTSQRANAITCADGIQALFPCEQFLVGGGGDQPSSECCAGAQNLNNMASTVDDQRALCECFKNAAGSYGVNSQRAEELPAMCHISLRLNVNPDVNCSTATYGMYLFLHPSRMFTLPLPRPLWTFACVMPYPTVGACLGTAMTLPWRCVSSHGFKVSMEVCVKSWVQS
ncbi:unnamed protein product [Rhodiola kirilowii]